MCDVSFLVGRTVLRLSVSYQFELAVPLNTDDVRIVLTRFSYGDARGVSHDFDPEADPTSTGPALALFQREITHASVDAATLRLRFDDGSEVVAPPDPQYEAWEITGPGRSLVVCTPGGEVAVWT